MGEVILCMRKIQVDLVSYLILLSNIKGHLFISITRKMSIIFTQMQQVDTHINLSFDGTTSMRLDEGKQCSGADQETTNLATMCIRTVKFL